MAHRLAERRGRRPAAPALAVFILVLGAFQAGVAVGSSATPVPHASVRIAASPFAREPSPTHTPRGALTDPRQPPAESARAVPPCRFGEVISRWDPRTDWASIVVDTRIRLDAGFAPSDLVDTSAAGLNGGHLVRSILVKDLARMARAARYADAAFAIQSAYRSFEEQGATFRYWVAAAGRRDALRGSARPGHSEHQLGTAIDVRSANAGHAPWNAWDWGRTDAGAWLLANAWRYGFVLSYPHGMARTSCYDYEPWHYRYVGRRLAGRIHASGLSPREWLLARP